MTTNLKTFTVMGLDPSLSNLGAVKLKVTLDLNDKCKVTAFKYLSMELSETKPAAKKISNKNVEDLERAHVHKKFLKRMLQDVDFCFVELPTGSQSARAMASYGICIGLFAWVEVPYFVLTPTELKLAACNKRTASKEEMMSWAFKQLPEADWIKGSTKIALKKNEHLADALAAIVAGLTSTVFKKSMLFIN
jgi:hypothetical protein